jgi:hypothetical protein
MQVCVAPGTQLPRPSQRAASVSVEPEQVWLLHAMPGAYRRHAPEPLQAPSVPQVVPPASAHWFSGSAPAAIGLQVPRALVSAQDRHVPVQETLQQTPCWQKPDAHSAFAVQSTPFSRLPHIVPLQTLTPLQLALVVQEVRHAPFVPHTYGSQGCCVPATHAPVPLHRPASVATAPAQVGMLQTVPDA